MEHIKNYMRQILRGMQYVHSKKICHRDLKPENILMNKEGVVKICDFGSAKVLSDNGLNTPYIVSRYYRAPELILACSDYTNAIDIWGKYSLSLFIDSVSYRMYSGWVLNETTNFPRQDWGQSTDRTNRNPWFAHTPWTRTNVSDDVAVNNWSSSQTRQHTKAGLCQNYQSRRLWSKLSH